MQRSNLVDLNLLQSRAEARPEQHNTRNKQDESRDENVSSDLREVIKQHRDNSPTHPPRIQEQTPETSRKLEHISSSRMAILPGAGVKLGHTVIVVFFNPPVANRPLVEHNLIGTLPVMKPSLENKTTTSQGHK